MRRKPIPLDIPPGIARDGSSQAVRGRYYDAENVRFHDDMPETMGGWTELIVETLDGPARATLGWATLSGSRAIAFGTTAKLWLLFDSVLHDITPIRFTDTLGTDPIETTSGSTTVTVAHAAHGAATGDTVHISGAAAVGGVTLDGEYLLTKVDDNSYTVTAASAAASSATGGGASVDVEYEITTSGNQATSGGWGVGGWGLGGWGGGPGAFAEIDEERIWSFAKWGEDLLATYQGGTIYHWDATNGAGTRAQAVSNAPTQCRALLVSSTDRHVIALGAESGGTFDPMLVRWPNRETLTEWTVTTTNTAEERRLERGTRLMAGVEVAGGALVLSDTSAYFVDYVGNPNIFSFDHRASNCGLISPGALVQKDGIGYWMGTHGFHQFDGVVRDIHCEIRDYIFEDTLNRAQQNKIVAGYNAAFDEIIWFYPSSNSTEIDAFVMVCFKNRYPAWTRGTIARTCWMNEASVSNLPIACGASGILYSHESGLGDDQTYYRLKTADVQIGEGEALQRLRGIIPDFRDQEGNVTLNVYGRKWPESTEIVQKSKIMEPGAKKVDIHMRNRIFQFELESLTSDGQWRLGTPKAVIRQHGGQ